jgi:hypothetical protein
VLPLRVPIVLVLAAIAALFAAAAPAQAAFPGRNGVIAYEARSGPRGIFEARNADGSGLRRLPAAGTVADPAFSPGGRRVAFARSGAVWAMQADGTGQRRLAAASGPDSEPAWSPAGDAVAFASGRTGRRRLFAVTADARQVVPITARPGADDRSPAWSARNAIAFVRRVRRGTDDLWVVGAPGRRPSRLTHTREDDSGPAWSPDGRRLAFVRGRGTRRDLYVMDAGGTGVRRLTRLASTVASPAWSPDGRSLTFALGAAGRRQLWIMRSDGRRLKRLTRGRQDPSAPDWQPALGDSVVAAAGDVACEPANRSFRPGLVPGPTCMQWATSDLLLRHDLDAVLALGDLQNDATPGQNYIRSFGAAWGRLKNLLRPVAGNHEWLEPGAKSYFDFFDGPGQFSGPVGQRDQGFYSFDIGAWHVVALNSECADPRVDPTGATCAAGSPQEQWLRADLAAHPTRCTLAMWHHPFFTSGTNAGRPLLEPLWRALYDHGVELVLNGHTHGYERFTPMDPLGGPDPARGVREIVVATGGASHGQFGSPQPNSEVRDNTTFGALRLRLRAASYSWSFMPINPGGFTDSGSAACH